MSFYEAQQLFEKALENSNPSHDPTMWNMLSGLVKLAQAANHLDSDVSRLSSDLRSLQNDVDRIGRSVR